MMAGRCISQAEFLKLSRQAEINNYIEECEQIEASQQLSPEECEEYYNAIEAEAAAAETGRLEGRMDFIMRYKDADPESYRLAKLLAGIPEY